MILIMKNFTNTFMKMFNNKMMQITDNQMIQKVLFNVATICAIIVGVITFALKAFNENNGAEKVRNFTLTVLDFVDDIIIKVMDLVDTDVPDVEVAQ